MITYNALISICSSSNKAEKGLKVSAEMQRRSLQPNALTYTADQGMLEGQQHSKALHIFAEMQQRGLQPDVITYSALISVCSKGNQAEKALDVFAEIQASLQRGPQPNIIAYSADNKAEKALEAFSEMQQRGLQLDMITDNALISACTRGDNAEKAFQFFPDMREGEGGKRKGSEKGREEGGR